MAVYQAVLDKADMEILMEGGTVRKLMSGGRDGADVFEIQLSDVVLKLAEDADRESE